MSSSATPSAAFPSADRAEAGGNAPNAADRLLRALHDHGIEYFFANAGTDFPSIIEGFGRAFETGGPVPKPLAVPHENAAVAMAHGYYMVTGRPQAVMVHTNVGTANTLNALIDASRDSVPLILMAGRTPWTEHGIKGARSAYIHWAQEMYDQAGMLREVVKWDYELRLPDQVEEVVARAYEVAMTEPRGPVYLSLPREVLAAAAAEVPHAPPRAYPAAPHPDPEAVAMLADWYEQAENPLIITTAAGRHPDAAERLARFAERFAVPVVNSVPRYVNLPYSHPMNFGFQSAPLLGEADLIIVLDAEVPWVPAREQPSPDARVVQIAEDPTFQRYPMRSFPSDLAIAASPGAALAALEEALAPRLPRDGKTLKTRRRELRARSAVWRQRIADDTAAAGQAPGINYAWFSHCVAAAVGPDAIIVNEYPFRLEAGARENPGTFFAVSPAGGLGWGFGAAIGAKLAAPDRLVVATLGDGAYMFANPTVCHWLAHAHDLPLLVVIYNNSIWNAVKLSTLGIYGAGAAARAQGKILADLSPSPAFEKLVEASGGVGFRVEAPAELPGVLKRAVEIVTRDRRQVLVNVIAS
ncbi:MAG: thiamine pyrophosphate-requiring protein [Stellaceae bacterium]